MRTEAAGELWRLEGPTPCAVLSVQLVEVVAATGCPPKHS